jgi:tetratricopeptide (TPR) repeat protein
MSTHTAPRETLYEEADKLLREGKYQEAHNIYLQITSTFANEFLAVKGLAITAMNTGDLRGASQACRLVLQIIPEDVDCLIMLGVISNLQDDPEGSEAFYKKALAIDPSAYDAYFNLGCLYYGQKRWEACLPMFAQAQKFSGNPEMGADYVTRAKLDILFQR